MEDICQMGRHTNAPLRRNHPHPVPFGQAKAGCSVGVEAYERFRVLLASPLDLALLEMIRGHEPAPSDAFPPTCAPLAFAFQRVIEPIRVVDMVEEQLVV
jgi:hypothetical protein